MNDFLNFKITGHVLVKDDLGNVIVDAENAIHPKNIATAFARGLSNSTNGQIFKIKFGNQGTYIDSSEQIVFRPPNTTGDSADLYNPTYVEIVDETNTSVGGGNSVTYTNVPASTTTRVIITSVISSNEAVNRATDTSDSATPAVGTGTEATLNPEGQYFFDELGLFTQETSGTLLDGAGELMLSHLIMSPWEHTGNREHTIVYSLTISVS